MKNTNPHVCAVVLNWNQPKATLECLNSLVPFIQCRQLALVVCDNASGDNSIQQISNWAAQYFCLQTVVNDRPARDGAEIQSWDFLLVQTGSNLGYAGGNNVGIGYALAHKQYDFIWILNNDTLVHEQALDALLECVRKNPNAGAVGSTIVDYHERDWVQMAGGCCYNPLTTIIKSVYKGQRLQEVLAIDDEIHLDYVSGAAMFCRAEMFRKIGLLDEQFFLYYEELDLACRMRDARYSLLWCKESIVYHKGGVSTGGRSLVNQRESPQSSYHENLSTLLFTKKHYPRLLFFAAILRFFGKSLAYLIHRRFQYSALVTAYQDALLKKKPITRSKPKKSLILSFGTNERA